MIEVFFTSAFVRAVKALPEDLFEQTLKKIELFKNKTNHSILDVHKLHGKLSNCWSFSVNYGYRVVFEYIGKGKVLFHNIGNHKVYRT